MPLKKWPRTDSDGTLVAFGGKDNSYNLVLTSAQVADVVDVTTANRKSPHTLRMSLSPRGHVADARTQDLRL